MLVASAISLSLIACGGGGSSSSNEQNTPTKITYSLSLSSAENINITLDEKSTITVDLNESTNSTKGITYTFSTAPVRNYISASVANQQLTITIDEVENNEQTTLTVTGEVEGEEATVELALAITNNSAEAVIEEASLWQDQVKVFKYDDLEQVAPKYIQAAYFAGVISLSEQQTLASDFQTTIDDARNVVNFIEESESLLTALTQYKSSSITESKLIQVLARQKAVAQAQSDNIISALKLIADLNVKTPTLPISTYQYIAEYNTFSAVIGNSELGEFKQGKWLFSGDYQFLNELVPVLGTPSPCDAI